MKQFMDENFLLQTETAQKLYHEHSAKMPIIDYHCHLVPSMVANDHKFRSVTEAWLGGDHYKWRAMRTNMHNMLDVGLICQRVCMLIIVLNYHTLQLLLPTLINV